MPLRIACACGNWLQVRDELIGKRVRCPACKAISFPSPWLKVRGAAGAVIARFPGNELVNEETVQATGHALLALVEEGCRRLALDFGEVELVGSAMVSKLIALREKLQKAGGRLTMFNLNRPVRGLFTMLALDQLFDVRDREEEAVQAVH